MKKSRQQVWNILSNAIFTTLGNIRRNLCTSSVVPESLVAPVARATTLSPSASVAYYTPRFILNAPLASLASLARSLRGNKAIFKHLCTSFCTSWNILGAFGGVVGHLESSWTHLRPSWSRIGASQGVCVIFYPCESHLKPS